MTVAISAASTAAGRSCPLHYRYAPASFARVADICAETVYIIGGLYGNLPALDAILALAAREAVKPTLIFNGDFNWFNVDHDSFAAVNRAVLKHVALRGNVETELGLDAGDAGCGCAYPDYVDDADVNRSNQIMQRLRHTALAFPDLCRQLTQLPMFAVAQIGARRFGIVHGDAESLAGWRFAHDSLHQTENVTWLNRLCRENHLAGFASSHTCLPALRRFVDVADAGRMHVVINNGAAGMPNFSRTQHGVISRLSIHPAPAGLAQYGEAQDEVYVDAIPVRYDVAAFHSTFVKNWPAGSPAHRGYFQRLVDGPDYEAAQALGVTPTAPGWT